MKHIVKRHGSSEIYDERKLYASVFAACIAVRVQPRVAELISAQVAREVGVWLDKKHEVTSKDLLKQSEASLRLLNPDAAFLYKHHGVIS